MSELAMHPLWKRALGQLKRSIYAESVFSSVITEMVGMETFRDGFMERIHQLCFQTSFCRNQACGHMIRLHYTSSADDLEASRVAQLVVHSLYMSRYFDKQVDGLLEQNRNDEFCDDEKGWVHLLRTWHREREDWLLYSHQTVKELLPTDIWDLAKKQAKAAIDNIDL